ncbi:MAG: thylakoid membrane photosystem I accumulation factor [Cyanophyceae cyanobacterium]
MNRWFRCLICLLLAVVVWSHFLGPPPALANIDDDKYEGNIFILYAGNGSLIPPRTTLKQSLEKEKPAILVFYVDDSSDCKQFAIVVSRFQEFYGRAASIIPVDVDTLPFQARFSPEEPGYYYEGVVPQTVVFDQQGEVVLNAKGQVSYEEVDDVLREVFDLLPRSESVELKRRPVNEFSGELAE